MDPPVQIGQYVLGKNLGIGAFGKVSYEKAVDIYRPQNPWCQAAGKSGLDCGETFYLSLGARLAYRLEFMVACAGGRAHMSCSRPSAGSVRILNCSHRHDPPRARKHFYHVPQIIHCSYVILSLTLLSRRSKWPPTPSQAIKLP